ncbi:MAG: amino acid ABC transporter substrate-binding protein [Deltaproteobacteria bacterium]|nr:amino acid ABC transporter substrate-binding protein [Deltaproteobacteria bacterium]
MTTKRFIALIFTLAFYLSSSLGSLILANEVSAATTAGPIKIGLIVTLSGGPLGMQGIDMRDGALLALKEAAQMEEMRGRSFELVVADDEGDPEIEEEKVSAILGPVNSSCALALVPVVSEAKIPMITLATHPGLTRPLKRYVFRGTMSDNVLGKLMVDYTTIILTGRKIALFYEDSPYG